MRIVVVAIALLIPLSAEAKITCETRPGSDGMHWSWRVVDGEKCWYRGARRMSRSRLHWTENHEPKKKAPVRAPVDVMFADCLQLQGEGCDHVLVPGGLIDAQAFMNEFVNQIRPE